jgi:hypothetical protein
MEAIVEKACSALERAGGNFESDKIKVTLFFFSVKSNRQDGAPSSLNLRFVGASVPK